MGGDSGDSEGGEPRVRSCRGQPCLEWPHPSRGRDRALQPKADAREKQVRACTDQDGGAGRGTAILPHDAGLSTGRPPVGWGRCPGTMTVRLQPREAHAPPAGVLPLGGEGAWGRAPRAVETCHSCLSVHPRICSSGTCSTALGVPAPWGAGAHSRGHSMPQGLASGHVLTFPMPTEAGSLPALFRALELQGGPWSKLAQPSATL